MRNCILTRRAEALLDALHRRSLLEYGPVQTNRFMKALRDAAAFAAKRIGKTRTRQDRTGGSGVCLYPVHNHFLAYRPLGPDHIVVLGVFRQSRDIERLLAQESPKFQKEFAAIEQAFREGTLKLPPN